MKKIWFFLMLTTFTLSACGQSAPEPTSTPTSVPTNTSLPTATFTPEPTATNTLVPTPTLTSTPAPCNHVDISGKWDGSWDNEDGKFPSHVYQLELTQTGCEVTGTYSTDFNDPNPIEDGVIEGNKFTFTHGNCGYTAKAMGICTKTLTIVDECTMGTTFRTGVDGKYTWRIYLTCVEE